MAIPKHWPFLLLGLMVSGFGMAHADVLNVEFKFTPYTGDLKADHVESVAGKATVFLNNVPVVERDIEAQSLPVLFDNREIAPSVWVPAASLGPVVRKGKNTLRIRFEPAKSAPYQAQFSWAIVTDQTTESSDAGRFQATNQTGEGQEDKAATGKIEFQREFQADFAQDRPWHHYPPVTDISEEDKQQLAALLKARAEAFKPKFAGIYALVENKPGLNLAEARKAKCLDKAYAAGVRMPEPALADLEFVTTGNPEVVLKRKDGPLFQPDQQAFGRIKGENLQMCAAILLSLAYPQQLAVVRKPDGAWEAAE